jgi:hypothetical protein
LGYRAPLRRIQKKTVSLRTRQEGVSERNCLIEMGHPQPPTPIRTDNTFARGIVTGTIKQKRSKAIDMGFYWLKDRYQQK